MIEVNLTERRDGMWLVDIKGRTGAVEHFGPIMLLSVALEIIRQRVEQEVEA